MTAFHGSTTSPDCQTVIPDLQFGSEWSSASGNPTASLLIFHLLLSSATRIHFFVYKYSETNSQSCKIFNGRHWAFAYVL